MKTLSKLISALFLGLTFVSAVAAQTKKTPRPGATPAIVAAPTPEPTPDGLKKNGRPADTSKITGLSAKNYDPTYFYEYTRPGFVISHVLIEHDAAGKGKISFLKNDLPDMLTDPLQLTPATQKAIDEALARLDFLSSTENYQYPKDFSNMGNVTFRYINVGRERTVKYNWTDNKDAMFLMDEYRRITNEAVWRFELAGDRVNQPLNTPRQLDALDAYLQRNEIADPPHLVPFLKELANDERLPLIARNHATRLIARVEKTKK